MNSRSEAKVKIYAYFISLSTYKLVIKLEKPLFSTENNESYSPIAPLRAKTSLFFRKKNNRNTLLSSVYILPTRWVELDFYKARIKI